MSNAKSLQIIPFRCPECSLDLAALEYDLVYYCHHCGAGLMLKDHRIQKIPISFATPKMKAESPIHYLPFWRFHTDGQLYERQTHPEFQRRTLSHIAYNTTLRDESSDNTHSSAKEARKRFSQPFYVPAFASPRLVNLGAQFTVKQPSFEPGSGHRLLGGIISEAEAREVADLVYIFIEAAKPDYIKSLDFALKLSDPRIVAFPFARDEDRIRDLTFGLRLFPDWIEDWHDITTFA